MGSQHRNGTTRNPRSNTVGPAGENYGYSRSQDQPCTIGSCQKTQLFGEDVAGFQIRRQQDIRISSDRGMNPFRTCGLLADGIVEGQGTIQNGALDLSAFGHLAESGSV